MSDVRKRKMSGDDNSDNLKKVNIEGFIDPFPTLDPDTPPEVRHTYYLQYIIGKLQNLEGRLTSIELKCQTLENRINDQDSLSKIQNTSIQELKSRIINLEKALEENEKFQVEVRSNNIIFHGLQQHQNLHPGAAAEDFIRTKLKADPKKVKINCAKYISCKDDKVSLVLSLGAKEDKGYLYSFAKNLKGSSLSISDDLTQAQRQRRKILLMKRRELLDNRTGTIIKIYDKAMCVDGDWYDLQQDGNVVKRPLPPSRPPISDPC